jgi:hypothetical protein
MRKEQQRRRIFHSYYNLVKKNLPEAHVKEVKESLILLQE